MSGTVRAAILRERGYFSGRITADVRPERSRMVCCLSKINETGYFTLPFATHHSCAVTEILHSGAL
jgi:hypothetical protein